MTFFRRFDNPVIIISALHIFAICNALMMTTGVAVRNALMMITGVIETSAKCHISFFWP